MHEIKYEIWWSLEDTSGDCSPSGSTTIDFGREFFDDIEEKDRIVDGIRYSNDSENTKLYGTFNVLHDGVVVSEEDVEF